MTQHDIKYNGTELTIEGYFKKGSKGGYLEPDDPNEFEIIVISANGIDITDLIKSDIITEIENKVLTENY